VNKLRRTLVALALVASLGAVSVYLKLSLERREAKQLLTDLEELERDAHAAKLAEFLKKHRHSIHPLPGCKESRCVYLEDLNNSPLLFIHLSSPADFYVAVTANKGVVQEVYVRAKTFISGQPYTAAVRGTSIGGWSDLDNTKISTDGTVDESGRLKYSVLEFGPLATPAERAIAFQMNVDCLFELKGCSDPSQIVGRWPSHINAPSAKFGALGESYSPASMRERGSR
jgi:hypothetical protein